MNKALIIAKREYRAQVRTKAFLISIIAVPLLMCGGIIGQKLLKGKVDVDDKRFVVIDHTGQVLDKLEQEADERNATAIFEGDPPRQVRAKYIVESPSSEHIGGDLRYELSDRVRRNELYAFIEISPSLLDENKDDQEAAQDPPLTFHAETAAIGSERNWFGNAINNIARSIRFQRLGLDAQLVSKAIKYAPIESLGLYTRSQEGEVKAEKTDRELMIMIPILIMMLMFMTVMISAQPMLGSVLEEKQQRIAEVLLGSARPFDLMLGKLVGNVGVAMTIVAVYFTGGYILANQYGFAHMIPTHLVGWFIVYQILAVLLFGSVFTAIGAACTELKEAQSLLMPVMVLLVLPMMVWFTVLEDPMGKVATWLSLFPPSAPMLMLLRQSVSSAVPVWQPVLAVVLISATTVLCIFAAGRVFRIGILSQGKAPKLTELAGWIIRG